MVIFGICIYRFLSTPAKNEPIKRKALKENKPQVAKTIVKEEKPKNTSSSKKVPTGTKAKKKTTNSKDVKKKNNSTKRSNGYVSPTKRKTKKGHKKRK